MADVFVWPKDSSMAVELIMLFQTVWNIGHDIDPKVFFLKNFRPSAIKFGPLNLLLLLFFTH